MVPETKKVFINFLKWRNGGILGLWQNNEEKVYIYHMLLVEDFTFDHIFWGAGIYQRLWLKLARRLYKVHIIACITNMYLHHVILESKPTKLARQ